MNEVFANDGWEDGVSRVPHEIGSCYPAFGLPGNRPTLARHILSGDFLRPFSQCLFPLIPPSTIICQLFFNRVVFLKKPSTVQIAFLSAVLLVLFACFQSATLPPSDFLLP